MTDLTWNRDGADWPNREASRFVEARGIRWHVQRLGQGPALLLIHGTGAATHSWRGLLPMLAPHFDVIAPDLPGHGFTASPAPQRLSLPGMAADLAALLRQLGVAPDIAVGHSAGAAILARMCLDRKIAPRLLVSLNGAFMPFGGVAQHLFSPLAKLLVLNPMMPRLFAWQASHAGAVERLIRNTGSTLDPRGIALYRKLVRSPAHVAAALRMMANWQLSPLVRDLPTLKTKLLLVAAGNDRSISPDVARQVRDLVPDAMIERMAGLGHLAHEEAPQRTADLIVRYAWQAEIRASTFTRSNGAKYVN
jgi:magnesium chelatase accessory protein